MRNYIEGLVIKAYNSFYYVKTEQSEELFTCKLRGKFKQERFSLLPGDRVHLVPEENTKGVIDTILPRTNTLLRPAVANAQQVVLVFAVRQPDYSYVLMDKMLALYAKTGLPVLLCFNKAELVDVDEENSLRNLYGNIGYNVCFCSALQERGLEELSSYLQNKISVFAGPSGVGKSSLLNLLQNDIRLETGVVSDKIGRGKHTTRYSQLLVLNEGGYIIDTPGFSSVDTKLFKDDNISDLFVEIKQSARACRFASCSHTHEPDCMVKQALAEGALSQSRYESYLQLYNEVKQLR